MRGLLVLLVLAAATGGTADKRSGPEPQRPVLQLRATPGAALPPASVLFVAELVGGDDIEELYCPEIEWDFANGRRSTSQQDCEPFTKTSLLERRFLVRQSYKEPGDYRVIITLRRTDRVVARAAATVHVASPGTEGSAWHSAINR